MNQTPENDFLLRRNLNDAGFSSSLIEKFVQYQTAGKYREQLRLLRTHRKLLLEQLHSEQKKIDTLDFLICAMKTKENADVLNQLLTSRRNPSIPQSHQSSEHRSNIDF